MAKPRTDFRGMEEKWKKFWEEEKIYGFNPDSGKKIYSIDTPPPTLSGRMHMGHACSYSQTDFIARYVRMKGFEVFYPFGTDDNGLPTERLVEKSRGVKSKEMPRDDFVKLCVDFLKEETPHFIRDWKDIGISCDWNLIYSTIDEHSRRISQWSFLDLHGRGRMYRKDAPAMWCPDCKTGVSQVEVEDREFDSSFVDIVFKVGEKDLIVGTTRPELLPACVCLFYHPEDERFKDYKGKEAEVPLFGFSVPVLEDKRANPEKGTGLVMCCTFGDQTDIEWQKAHNLPIKMVVSGNGKMNESAGKYNGLPIRKAREEIISDLKKESLLLKEKPIKHVVNVHERCGTEIEFVKSRQWFVKYLDLKDEMLKWGNELKWWPEFMKHRYDNWVKGLQWDWLVSNQRYFGVPFPVWYCRDCEKVILADEKNLPVDPLIDRPPVSECPECGCEKFVPEKDILNTWFTSSLTPQLSTKLTNSEEKLFPMSLRAQAHEIITFWLFNSVVKSRLHFGKNPWSDVAISGIVTRKGEKMSKSKGNVVAPQDVMEEYGADTLRYWAASTKLGRDLEYNEKDVITGKKFITKLLNASRFVFMNLNDYDGEKPEKLHPTDKLFLARLDNLVSSCTGHFDNYDFSRARFEADNFFWKVFCDNYLEIVKNRVYNGKGNEKISAQYSLYNGLLKILKLMAPFTPFITEEIYQEYFRKREKDRSIHVSVWPSETDVEEKDENAEEKLELLTKIISEVRQEKSRAKKPMNAEILLTLEKESLKEFSDEILKDLKSVTNSSEIKEGTFKVEFNN